MTEPFLRHFEKLFVAAFLGIFALALSPLVGRARAVGEEKARVEERVAKVERYFADPPAVPRLPVKDVAAELRAELDPAAVAEVEEFPAWVAHRRPSIAAFAPIAPPTPESKHVAPRARIVLVGHGSVKLEWTLSSENVCDVSGYRVERRADESRPWESVVELGPDATTYLDATAPARSRWTYRVVERGVARPDHQPLAADQVELAAVAGDADVPADFYVTLVGGTLPDPIAEPPVPGSYAVKVWRWHPPLGKFIEKSYFRVEEGKPIGAGEKMKVGAQTLAIDFSSGAVIVPDSGRKDARGRITVKVRWPSGHEDTIVEREVPAPLR